MIQSATGFLTSRAITSRAITSRAMAGWLGVALAASLSGPARADEGGANLYLAGSFASMAAVPGVAGWSTSLTYYHATAKIQPVTEKADLAYAGVTYSFATPVLDGQLALSLFGAVGRMDVGIADIRNDTRLGIMDVTPAASLRWSAGNHNYLVYTLTNAPSGTYNASRLANFGIGHWGQDGGFGYTYYDKDLGYELSAVAGMTYNFENPKTKYQNGIDAHIDFSASKFIGTQYQLGLVGYVYQQVTGDYGRGATLGPFKGRVAALGPQAGYLFPVGGAQGYMNLKFYREFAGENRPAGWNLWLTISISPQGA